MSNINPKFNIKTSRTPFVASFVSNTGNGMILITANNSNLTSSNTIYIGSSLQDKEAFIMIDNQKLARFHQSNTIFQGNLIPASNIYNIGNTNTRYNNIFINNELHIDDAILKYSNPNMLDIINNNNELINVNIRQMKLQESLSSNYSIIATSDTGSLVLSHYTQNNTLIKSVNIGDGSTSVLSEGSNLFFTYERAGIISQSSNMHISNYISSLTADQIHQGLYQKFIVNNIIPYDLLIDATLTTSNLHVIGNTTTINTNSYTTENLEIISQALDSSALKVVQNGFRNIAEFYSNTTPVITFNTLGLVGIGITEPNEKLHVLGNIKLTGNINNITSNQLAYLSDITSPVQQQINFIDLEMTFTSNNLITYTNTTSNNIISYIDNISNTINKDFLDTSNYIRVESNVLRNLIDNKENTITGGASTITTNNLAANVVLITNTNGKVASSTISSTQLNYLAEVVYPIQTQLDAKQGIITGASSSVVNTNLNNAIVVVSNNNGKIANSGITSNELSFLIGTTTNINDNFTNTSNWIGFLRDNKENIISVLPVSKGGIGTTSFASNKILGTGNTANAFTEISVNSPLTLAGGVLTLSGTSSQWTTSGNNIFYTTGNVGIGISSPLNYRLEVSGDINYTGTLRLNGDDVLAGKQNALTAGIGITIANNIIRVKYPTITPVNSSYLYTDVNNNLLVQTYIDYADVANKPTSFQPSSHMHNFDDITGTLPVNRGGTGKTTMTANRLLGCGATPNQYDEITIGSGLNLSGGTLTASGGGSSQWTTSGNNIYYTTGNVGIGTTNPISTNLHINGSSVGQQLIISDSANLNYQLLIGANNSQNYCSLQSILQGQGMRNLVLNQSGGNVGIGTTTNINNILQVGDGARLRISNGASDYSLIGTKDVDDATNTRIVISGNTRSGGYAGNIEYIATSTGSHIFYTTNSSTERMRIISSGNVGIGNTNPIGTLALGNSAVNNSDGFLIIAKNNGAGGARHCRIGYNANFDLVIGDYGNNNTAGTWVEQFKIHYAAPANSLYVNSSGNVGIGTTNPLSLLNIKKTGTNNYIKVDAGGTNANYGGIIMCEDGVWWGHTIRYDAFSDKLFFSTQDNTPTFTDRMTLTYSGNFGIGTTNPATKLDVDGNIFPRGGILDFNGDNSFYKFGQIRFGCGNYQAFSYANIRFDTTGSVNDATTYIRHSTNGYSKFDTYIQVNTTNYNSDERIKTNINDIDDNSALNLILQIEPKTYNYLDVERGTSNVYGFIAQQIKKVIPEAITITADYIPNILEYGIFNSNNTITFKNNCNIILKKGDYIRIDYQTQKRNYWEIFNVYSMNTFEIKNMDINIPTNSQVYIYGTMIQDFHTVDKSYIYTLNVCATQELHRIIQQQNVAIKSLTQRLSTIEDILSKYSSNL